MIVGSSLGKRLFAAFLLLAFAIVGVSTVLVDRAVRRMSVAEFEERLRDEVTMMSQMSASALFAPVAPGDTTLQGPIRELGGAVHTHLTLLTADGVVVADSEAADPTSIAPQWDGAEIVAARRGGTGVAIRGEGDERRLYVAQSIVRDGTTLGVARASLKMSVVDEHAATIRDRTLSAALLALGLACVLAGVLTNRIVRPVRKLAAAARRMGAGDLDTPVAIMTRDEIGDLAGALGEMSRSLKRTLDAQRERNADMRRVLDAVDQGLLTVTLDGALEAERSACVDRWFGARPPGTRLWELFDGRDAAAGWLELAWGQLTLLPLEVAVEQLPKRLEHGARTYSLDVRSIGPAETCERLLVVITDVTAVVEAERTEASKKDILSLLQHAEGDRVGVLDFLAEADVAIGALSVGDPLVETKRRLHTLKGTCGLFGLERVARLCHEAESILAEGHHAEASIERVRCAWKELRGATEGILGLTRGVVVSEADIDAAATDLRRGVAPSAVADAIDEWRMERVAVVLARLGAEAQRLGQRFAKAVEVRVDCDASARLDRTAWAPFWAALVHAVRNAVDHGIEPSDDRERAGKAPTGVVTLRARRHGAAFVVEVEDDGRGIDWTALRAKALARGLPVSSHADLVSALFADGISTAASVSDVSGRGVGMGALRAAAEGLRGRVTVDGRPGRGARFSCVFPAHTLEARRAGAASALGAAAE